MPARRLTRTGPPIDVVRKAIQLAIDREAVIEHYEGTARPTYSIVAQPMAEYDPASRAPGTAVKGWPAAPPRSARPR